MTGRGGRWSPRGVLLVALLATTLGAAACGDDGDGDKATAQGQGEGQPRETGDAAPVGNTPEAQIRTAHEEFIKAFYSKDAESICSLLSRKGQRQWRKNAKTCEEGVKQFFGSIQGLGERKPKVIGVRVDGSRALARTQVKGSDVYPVPFIKEDGEWKIDAGGGI
jgi:hypothetical protein